MNFDDEWLFLLERVVETGESRRDRTGVGTTALFGTTFTVSNTAAFPATTIKKLGFEQVKAELACFLRGYTKRSEFNAMGCKIWDEWGEDLGPIYGKQWVDWNGINQLSELVNNLKTNPYSRRHVVSNWNVSDLPKMALPPCHVMFQCYVSNDEMLDMIVTMRSVDLFIGLPFDVASYALLQRLIAKECNLLSGRLTFSLGDAHVYNNHREQVSVLLKREKFPAPLLNLRPSTSLKTFVPHDAELVAYQSHPFLKGALNV